MTRFKSSVWRHTRRTRGWWTNWKRHITCSTIQLLFQILSCQLVWINICSLTKQIAHIYNILYIYWGVEILKCSTCLRASYLKKVTCPDKILLDKLSCFLYKHLILANTVVKLNLFILSITSLHTILSMVLIKLAQTSLPKWSLITAQMKTILNLDFR